MNGRAIGLVETRLEDIGNAELLRDPDIFFRGTQGHVFRLEDVHAAEQDKAVAVADVDGGGDGDGGQGELL
ncbi:hypothetical protein D3C78_1753910 [compost metagenome]